MRTRRLLALTVILVLALLLPAGCGSSTPNTPPDQPVPLSPTDGSMRVGFSPALQSSEFSDPDSEDAHAASQWRIGATSDEYDSPVFDSGVDDVNLTQIGVEPGILSDNTTYYWQVRYQDKGGAWSMWSAESSFTTVPQPRRGPGDRQGQDQVRALRGQSSHQYGQLHQAGRERFL